LPLVLGFIAFGTSVLELMHEATNTLAGGTATSTQTAALRGLATTEGAIAVVSLCLAAALVWLRGYWFQAMIALASVLWLIALFDFVLGAQGGSIP
jgi:hypothetical protein